MKHLFGSHAEPRHRCRYLVTAALAGLAATAMLCRVHPLSAQDKNVSDNTTTPAKKKDLIVTRVFDAPVELVWRAWTDPEHVKLWWGPDRFTCPSAMIDFREGGTSLVCMRAPKEFGGQDMYSTWAYTKITPKKSFEYIHNLADKDGNKADPLKLGLPADFPKDQRHTVTFKDLGNGKTEMTVVEYGWTVGKMLELSEMGLGQCLDKMAASFRKVTK